MQVDADDCVTAGNTAHDTGETRGVGKFERNALPRAAVMTTHAVSGGKFHSEITVAPAHTRYVAVITQDILSTIHGTIVFGC